MDIRFDARPMNATYTHCDPEPSGALDDAIDALEDSGGVAAQLAALTVRAARDERELHVAERHTAEASERAHADAQFAALEEAAKATRDAGLVAGVAEVASGVASGVSAGYRYSADVAGPREGAGGTRAAATVSAAREGAVGGAKIASALLESAGAEARAIAATHDHAAQRAGRDAADARDAERTASELVATALRFHKDTETARVDALAALARRV